MLALPVALRYSLGAVLVALVGLLATDAVALDFSWSATSDTLDWFGVDNPVVGNSGWTLLPNFITPQAPDDPGDRAFISLAGKTVTLSNAVTVGSVTLGAQQLPATLRLTTSGATLTVVDDFNLGPGGQLEFLGGTVNVTGGPLTSEGLIHSISNIATINASVVNSGGGEVQVDAGATLLLNSPGTTLTNQGAINTIAGGTLQITNGVTLAMDSGVIDNQGELVMGNGLLDFSSGSTAGNPLTLNGTTLTIAPAAGNGQFSFNGGVLNGDIAAGQTVIQQGTTQTLVTPDSFTNAGEFHLAGAISAETALTVAGGGVVTNTGQFRAVTNLPFGKNRRVNGTIDNQSNLALDPSVTLTVDGLTNSGTADIGAGATLRITGAGSNAGAMNFATGATMMVDSSGSFTHSAGVVILEHLWEFAPSTTLNLTGGSLTGGGMVQLNGATLNLTPGAGDITFQFAGGVLNGDIESGQTVRHNNSFTHLTASDSFTNEGVIVLTGANLNVVRLNVMGGGVLTNAGTLHAMAQAPNGFRRRVDGVVDNQNTLTIDPGVAFTTNGLLNTGDIQMGAGASLTVIGGVFSQDGGAIHNEGITIESSTVNYNGGDIIGAPVVLASNTSLNLAPAVIGVAAFTHMGGTISGTIGTNTTVNLQANTIGTRVIQSNASLTNNGTLSFDQSPGGAVHLQVDGLELANEADGVVTGNGTVVLTAPGAKYVNRGRHATGASAGQFDIDGDFENASSGTLAVEIAGAVATDYDVMIATGAAQLAGQLEVNLLGGFTPTPVDSFAILSTSALSGEFDNVTDGARLQTLGLEGSFLVSYDIGAGVVSLSDFAAGDFNGDGKVDAADYTTWRDGLGVAYNQSHYDTWRANFGAGSPTPASLPPSVAPEPGALTLAVGLSIAVFARRRASRASYHRARAFGGTATTPKALRLM